MASLAQNFPWSEEFILLWLPVARGEQYYHHLLRGARYRTYAPVEIESVSDQVAAMTEIPTLAISPELESVLAKWGKEME